LIFEEVTIDEADDKSLIPELMLAIDPTPDFKYQDI
jgi:hypothetical protein